MLKKAVLTSRQHGVATIWLVATLGTKSVLKRVNRRDILRVDVPRACESIINSEVPLALRLQSNLLYGVSKVFDRQCSYVLTDTNSTVLSIKHIVGGSDFSGLDTTPPKIFKPNQLLLQDDPSFVPELACLGIDLEVVGVARTLYKADRSRSSFTHRSPYSSPSSALSLPRIIPASPESQSSFTHSLLNVDTHNACQSHREDTEDENRILESVDFAFDVDGNMLELEQDDRATDTHIILGGNLSSGPHFPKIQRVMEPVLGETHVSKVRSERLMGLENGGSSKLQHSPGSVTPIVFSLESNISSTPVQQQRNGNEEYISTAAMQRRPVIAHIPLDQTIKLANRSIREWPHSYCNAMASVKASKSRRRRVLLSKVNAEYWLSGIGNVGREFSKMSINHPLDLFHGEKFRLLFPGAAFAFQPRKRKHEADLTETSGVESRRVRSKYQQGYKDPDTSFDNNTFDGVLNENDIDPEIARATGSPSLDERLAEFSPLMPWNVSATSARSSSLQFLKRPCASSLLGGDTADQRMEERAPIALDSSALSESHSALTSFNTVKQRRVSQHGDGIVGRFHDSVPTTRGLTNRGSAFGSGLSSINRNLWDESTLDGKYDNLNGQRLDSLTRESMQFLHFCASKIHEHDETYVEGQRELPTDEISAGFVREISFTRLLPPNMSTNVMAAQGFFHVLFLTTTSRMNVRQNRAFDELFVCMVY